MCQFCGGNSATQSISSFYLMKNAPLLTISVFVSQLFSLTIAQTQCRDPGLN